ncbi:MAG TPA: hypothetical protein VK714_06520 [Myxococcota bacterium]|nr:hypothetical protein [Myxococcota bacterium]
MAKWAVGILVAIAVLFWGYTWLVLHWSYSKGERAGYVQKLSKKGWICKTWEGEMALVSMPGTVAEKFYFTVPTDSIADEINRSMGRRVSLTYEQHIGIPTSCFAETQYFISKVAPVDDGRTPPVLPGASGAPMGTPGTTR